jgi:hypothetical protein
LRAFGADLQINETLRQRTTATFVCGLRKLRNTIKYRFGNGPAFILWSWTTEFGAANAPFDRILYKNIDPASRAYDRFAPQVVGCEHLLGRVRVLSRYKMIRSR